jgi:hypothetical protein
MSRGLIGESTSSSVVPTLLTPKKNDRWRIGIESTTLDNRRRRLFPQDCFEDWLSPSKKPKKNMSAR